ncbi:unnamed protein product [Umbelopsis ramanniana]
MSKFHVVGAGAIGCLVSVLLAENGHHVTLIVRHADLCPLFNGIRYTKSGEQPKLVTAGVSVELASQTSTIENLIITTKAQDTTAALTSIKHRWVPSTTALFLENGMAWKESLDASGIPATSANVAVGVNKHGVERSGHFEIIHHNWKGGMDFAAMPSDQAKTRNVLKSLTTIPDMNAKLIEWDALMDSKIDKLVLLDRPDAMSLMRSICTEAAQVFDHKHADHLYSQVQQVCRDTNLNSSSMLQDIRNARPTEIDAINGWLCRRANNKNIQLPVNQTLVQLVKAMSK